eukprot:1351755-Pleurochrysis_carterae.AAC.2
MAVGVVMRHLCVNACRVHHFRRAKLWKSARLLRTRTAKHGLQNERAVVCLSSCSERNKFLLLHWGHGSDPDKAAHRHAVEGQHQPSTPRTGRIDVFRQFVIPIQKHEFIVQCEVKNTQKLSPF